MTYMKCFIALFAIISVGTLLAEKQPLERYQPIIDRRPFGQPPPGYDPDSTVLEASAAAAGAGATALTAEELSQEQAELQRAVSFSMMNINTDGSVSVGFTDSTVQGSPKSYYMREHDTREGWTVKSVDIYEKTAVLEKDGVEVSLKLGANSKQEVAKGARGGGRVNLSGPTGRSALLGGPRAVSGVDAGPMSHATRRARREQEAAAAERARAEQEAERKRLAEESAAKAAEEKAAREEERAATRQQLQAIQEELRRARDEAARQREQQEKNDEDNDS